MRLSSVVRNGSAAIDSLPGSDNQLFASGLCFLSALSLFAIGMLFVGKRRGVILFIGAELAIGLWLLLFGDHTGFIYPQIAIAIMLLLGRGAKYDVKWFK